MPVPEITWKRLPASPTISVAGATLLGWMQTLNDYIVSLVGNADCHWEVASFRVAASPYYLVLKRKNGDPGRILFMAVTASVGTTYNPQLRRASLSWNAAGVRWAYFPAATSDVPANLIAASGDVFTNPGEHTGLAANFATYTGTASFVLYSSSAGIVIRQAIPEGTIDVFCAVGDLLHKHNETSKGVSIRTSSFIDGVSTSPGITTTGGYTNLLGVPGFIGRSAALDSALTSYMRDHSIKRTIYFPIYQGSVHGEMTDLHGYKLRQIVSGPNALAGEEIINIVDGGAPSIEAIFLGTTTSTNIWLINKMT